MTRRKKRNRTNQKNRSQATQARLGLESLEPRRLMTASPSVSLDAGTLTIQGHGSRNDHVKLSESVLAGREYVSVTSYGRPFLSVPKIYNYQKADIDKVVFSGGRGKDTLSNQLNGVDVIFHGGRGTDKLVQHVQAVSYLTDTKLTHSRGFGSGVTEQVNLSSVEKATLIGTDSLDLINASGFTGRATLKGGKGDDLLIGGSGKDKLYGGIGDDLLIGKSGKDKLYGGIGDDRLLGGTGRDKLYGGIGNDGLIGGRGRDTVKGNSGQDRFLNLENDKIKDKKAEDVEFTFVDTPFLEFKTHDGKTSIKTAAFWSDKEAAIVDQAFAELQTKTSNTRLLKTADGDEMIVKRFGTWVYADGRGAGLAYNGGGTIGFGSAVFTDKTTGAEAPEKAHEVVFHEIGHNWDTREERDWVEETDDYNWKNRSGWTQDDMSGDSRYTKSGNDEWYYENSADFVRDYAKHNPREDFASHFAAYFMREAEETSGRGIDPIESAPLKEEFIDRFIDSL